MVAAPRRPVLGPRLILPFLATAAVVAAQATLSVPAASAAAPSLAPVLGSAAQGGSVIVWLADQHSNLDLRTQASQRIAAAHADQAPIVAMIQQGGGTDITQLVSVNAVAATISADTVAALRAEPGVKEILPDGTISVGDPETTGPALQKATITPDPTDRAKAKPTAGAHASPSSDASDGGTTDPNPFPTANDCGTQTDPLIEPEALGTINAPAMTDAGLATEPGHGVIVANDGISTPPTGDLVGNPNFVRPAADGGGSVVIGATPGDTTDSTDGEYYGDASSIAAQGTVEYQYSKELPYSNLPDTCYFKLVGDAPGASLVDTNDITTPESSAGDTDPGTLSDSEIIAGIDAAVTTEHADVINESYGYSNSPGSYAIHYAANDAAVAAGVTVVASSGDSGDSGTVSSPASDPNIIAVGATNTLRLNAMAYGFTGWVNNDITPLSSGGPTPEDKVVDLVAPGYGGEAACNPDGSDCPTNTATEAFGGTSESSPLVAGAAADVIQAYRDSHHGDSPSPALVKELLTGTATDVDAPAQEQGAGQVNILAAMKAAQGTVDSTVASTAIPSLIPTPTQLDLTGAGGSTSFQSVSLYNPSNVTANVTGTYRELGPEQQLGDVVTENVSAPDPSLPVPADGAQAAPDISFQVPAGLDRLDADMIWPDPTNSAILSFTVIDPEGRLRQISYDYGTAGTATRAGSVPDIQHVEVANPEAGTWHVEIKWANGRSHLQEPPNVPGTYTGTVSFKVSGQNWTTTPATPTIAIPAHRTVSVPLQVAFPTAPGDHPESVQFTADDGAALSLPIARRTLIPSGGGEFDTQITSTVGRGIGQISTFDINVPSGRADLGVTLTTPDGSADDPMTLFLVNPTGTSVATHTTTTGGRTRTVNGVPLVAGSSGQTVTYHVANPMAGTWEIDVELNLTTSGQEFSQTVVGDVLPQAPTIGSPPDGSAPGTQTPTLGGTGAPGDTVTVWNGTTSVCQATVAVDGTWSCTPTSALPAGQVTLTATQADQTGDPSLASAPVTLTIPATATVTLTLDPAAPTVHQAVTLTATTTNVPDGTTATFRDGPVTLGANTVASGTATLSLPGGFPLGHHALTASVPATDTSLAATSAPVDVVVGRAASTIALHLNQSTVAYGHAATGTVSVGGATGGTATVWVGSTYLVVPIDGSGSGSFRLPATLSVGTHTVSARYNGTADVAPSSTVTAVLTVTRARTTTSTSSRTHGHTTSVTIRIGGHASGGWPTGRVSLAVVVGHRPMTLTRGVGAGARGAVTVTVPSSARLRTAVASYGGDHNYAGSVSVLKR